MITNKDVGLAIRFYRQHRNLSYHMLATEVSQGGRIITAETITKLESGELTLTAKFGYYLCATLHCTMDELMAQAAVHHTERTADRHVKAAYKFRDYLIATAALNGVELIRRVRPIADDINAALAKGSKPAAEP